MIIQPKSTGRRRRIERRLAWISLLVTSLAFMAACSGEEMGSPARGTVVDAPHEGTFYGSGVPVGAGIACSYVVMDGDEAVEIGVALTDDALEGLPAANTGEGAEHGHVFEFYKLPMPADSPTPYRFVGLDWNPAGHEPAGIYTAPHFDFHFYTISDVDRLTIDPTDPAYGAKAANFPTAGSIPAGYVDAGTLGSVPAAQAAIPQMGMHWIDASSPELNGGIFTETFLYGSWNGEVVFVEPMITRSFLQTKPQLERQLPAAADGSGPSSYRIYWNEATAEHRIALRGVDR